MTRLAVLGARGRMGQAVVGLAAEHGCTVTVTIDATEGNLAELDADQADVLVDFSAPTVTAEAALVCAARGVALVSGTTGLDPEGMLALAEASERVPVLWEPNMSVGVLVLGSVLRAALEMLGEGFDVEVVEVHHGKKVDAPSGTANRLAEVARSVRDGPLVTGRAGKPGMRTAREIGVLALRGGDVVGDHTVHLLGKGERLELTHRATSRDVFARGALRAARWIHGKPAGRYGLADVVARRITPETAPETA